MREARQLPPPGLLAMYLSQQPAALLAELKLSAPADR